MSGQRRPHWESKFWMKTWGSWAVDNRGKSSRRRKRHVQVWEFSGLHEKWEGSQCCWRSGNAGTGGSRCRHLQTGNGDLHTGALKITVKTLTYIRRWRAGGGLWSGQWHDMNSVLVGSRWNCVGNRLKGEGAETGRPGGGAGCFKQPRWKISMALPTLVIVMEWKSEKTLNTF